jgi:hypothetical protein
MALDAPAIALVWQRVIAAPTVPTWGESSALFFAVWAVYVADRLLDGRALRSLATEDLPLRHQFFRTQRRSLFLILGLALAGGAGSAAFLPASTIWRGVALAAGVAVYLLWNQAGIAAPARKWLKEVAVAGIFAVGCGLGTLGVVPWQAWLSAVVVLAACGWLNCLQIASLEREFDRRTGTPSLAAKPKFERLIFDLLPWALAAGFLILVAVIGVSAAMVCGLVGVVMLGATGRIGRRHGPEVGGAWADAALFVPALVVCVI